MPSKRIEAAELKELAGAGARMELRLNSGDLARVAELVASDQPDQASPDALAAVVDFDTGHERFPRLRIAVAGNLNLRCQRCLRPVAWPLELTTRLTVLDDEGQAGRLAEPFDSIVMEDGALTLDAVIEDEILAALPMAPMHEAGDHCHEAGEPATDLNNETGQRYRPFAALATMVGGDEGRKN